MSKSIVNEALLVRYLYQETTEEENTDIRIQLAVDANLQAQYQELSESVDLLNSIEQAMPSQWVTNRIFEHTRDNSLHH